MEGNFNGVLMRSTCKLNKSLLKQWVQDDPWSFLKFLANPPTYPCLNLLALAIDATEYLDIEDGVVSYIVPILLDYLSHPSALIRKVTIHALAPYINRTDVLIAIYEAGLTDIGPNVLIAAK